MRRQRWFEGRVPSWIHCELFERHGARPQELFVVAEDEAHNGSTAESVAQALLCTDCSALAGGAIDPTGMEAPYKLPCDARVHLHSCRRSAFGDDRVLDDEVLAIQDRQEIT